MSRSIRSVRIGTEGEVKNLESRFGKCFEMAGARVFWSVNGDVLIIASENWKDFLSRTEPTEEAI